MPKRPTPPPCWPARARTPPGWTPASRAWRRVVGGEAGRPCVRDDVHKHEGKSSLRVIRDIAGNFSSEIFLSHGPQRGPLQRHVQAAVGRYPTLNPMFASYHSVHQRPARRMALAVPA